MIKLYHVFKKKVHNLLVASQGSDGNKIFPDYARGYPTSTSGIIVEDGYLLVSTANYVHNWAISYIVINGGTYPLGGDAGGYAIDVIQTTLFPVKKVIVTVFMVIHLLRYQVFVFIIFLYEIKIIYP